MSIKPRLERKITGSPELIHAYIQTNVNRQLMRPLLHSTDSSTHSTNTVTNQKKNPVLVYVNVNQFLLTIFKEKMKMQCKNASSVSLRPNDSGWAHLLECRGLGSLLTAMGPSDQGRMGQPAYKPPWT